MPTGKHPRICLWCKKKGIHTVVGYSEIKNSHGICEKCKQDQLKTFCKKEKSK